MTLEEEMVGWTYDAVMREWSFPFLRYCFADGARATTAVVVGFDGTRMEDGNERGRDYESYAIIPGRYEHARAAFMAAEDPGAQRLWFLALDTMGMYRGEDYDAQAELEMVGRAYQLGLLRVEEVVPRYQYEYAEHGGRELPEHRLEETMLLAIASASYQDEDPDWPSYTAAYDGFILGAMKQLYPQAAESITIFEQEIREALPSFKENIPAAQRYIEALVNRGTVETLELPDLEP